MDTQLRYGPDYTTQEWNPALDFGRNRSLSGAIEQCNGQGVCRKETGVMCPSFQATREEQYSTRGRANLLRALIASPSLAQQKGIEAAAKAALDLCLACKGCKAECPSGVDMAKLKFEFTHHYYLRHRRPVRDYFFGYINELARWGAPLGGVINTLTEASFFREPLNRWLGIAGERALPKFGKRISARIPVHRGQAKQQVLLLRDSFTHFFEPEVEQAAIEILEACGLEVQPLPVYGAGRTLTSLGFLEAARGQARRVVRAIQRLDPEGRRPVLGLEPSEINTVRDEWFDLLPEEVEEVRRIATRAWSVEEYLIRPVSGAEKPILRVANNINKNNSQSNQKILLHGHCSQKAQPPAEDGYAVGQQASAEFLQHLGLEVEIIDSGCCGMAGAFGYEAENYEVSKKVGELVLIPEIKKNPDCMIAATGTSCRTQIKDGSGRKAKHPIVIAAEKMSD